MHFPLHDTYGFCGSDFRNFLRKNELPRHALTLLYDKWYMVLTNFLAENFAAGCAPLSVHTVLTKNYPCATKENCQRRKSP